MGQDDTADAEGGELDGVARVRDGHDALHLVGDVGKGGFAVDHLVQDAAETPDVAGLAQFHHFGLLRWDVASDVGVDQGFGGHVVRSADVLLAVDVDGVVLDGVGDAKVDQFQTSLQEEEVGRFEVRVDNVMGVH